MKNKLLLLSVVGLLIIFSSCGAIGDSSKVGEDFYNAIKEKNVENVIPLLSEEALSATAKEDWIIGLNSYIEERGELKSFKRTGLNVSTSDGVTTTTLTYKVKYEKGDYNEEIILIKKGEEYFIQFYDADM